MFNSKDYRAKAAEYQNRARTSDNADEIREYGKLERTFSELAEMRHGWRKIPDSVSIQRKEPNPSPENDDGTGLRRSDASMFRLW
jgi:hypothetical protein